MAVAVAAVLPLVSILVLQSRSEESQDEADRLDASFVVAVGAPVDSADSDVLVATRIPEELTEPQADAALADRLAAVVAAQPEASCLFAEIDGRAIVAHPTHRAADPCVGGQGGHRVGGARHDPTPRSASRPGWSPMRRSSTV